MKNILLVVSVLLFAAFIVACQDDDETIPPVKPPAENTSPVVFNPEEVPYQKLSEYNFFEGNMVDFTPVKGVLPYNVITPLFSDYAKKSRFVWMPDSVKASYSTDYDILNFSNGTILIKNFYYDNVQPENERRVIETRVMYMLNDEWEFAEYVWNDDQTEAFLNMGGSTTNISFVNEAGISMNIDYRIPSEAECFTCHKVNDDAIPIGPKPQSINSDYPYVDGVKNQLVKWVEAGYLESNYPHDIVTTVPWDDASMLLEDRVRSYLDMNCGHCHRSGSHCDYRDLRFGYHETTNAEIMGVCMDAQVYINPDLSLIISGKKPEKSALYYRLNSVEEEFQMPMIGRSVVHQEGLQLMLEYIDSLDPCQKIALNHLFNHNLKPMKKALLLSALTLSLAVSAQDSCENALEVFPGTYTVQDSLVGAVPENSCFAFHTSVTQAQWYAYTAPEDIILVISSSLSQNAGVDTRLNVFTGTCDNLSCFAYNDDGGSNYLTYLEVFVPQDLTVYIVWDNRYDDDGFDFEISTIEYVAPLVNFTAEPLSGSGSKLGVVDMNGDHLDDIVSISSAFGQIQIAYQEVGALSDFQVVPSEDALFNPSWSMAAGDFDGNGYNDLLYGGGQGVSFMYANEDGTAYTHYSDTNYIFSQRTNFVDINNDGYLDAFICHDVDPNVYYINNENTSITFNQGGLGDVESGGNYGSIWVDYDMDGDVDLFLSKCRGGNTPAKINELHRNNGDGTFTEVGESLGLNDPIQTWSSAWGDFDNDGDFDIMIGVNSFADGPHKLLRNDGGVFVDVTEGSGIDQVTTSGVENICHDFDNDGFVDILGMGNTFMHNNGDMTFTQMPFTPQNGPVGDLNNDGFLDIVNGNTLYLNTGNDNNYIKVVTQGTASNLNGIGALITVYTPSGNFMRQIFSGDGFKYMSSLNAHFGLGQEELIDSLVIKWPSGTVDVHINPYVNTTLVAVEGTETSTVGIDDKTAQPFLVFPNPARDYLIIETPHTYNSLTYAIFDLNGKRVQQGSLSGRSINISNLNSGAYVLQLNADGYTVEQKVIKE